MPDFTIIDRIAPTVSAVIRAAVPSSSRFAFFRHIERMFRHEN
jgi:hypothetical protein